MIKNIRNIIRIFIALLILSGGNFVFALAHSDCMISSEMHITCEMECCKENPCIEDEAGGIVEISDETDSCCKTHIDEAFTGDVPLPVFTNSFENLNPINTLSGTEFLFPEANQFSTLVHKHKTTNILLITSVLRI